MKFICSLLLFHHVEALKLLKTIVNTLTCSPVHFYIGLNLLKHGYEVFPWHLAQPASRPVQSPKIEGACRFGRHR